MVSIFKVPEFITTMSGLVLFYMITLVLSDKMNFTLAQFLGTFWVIILVGLLSFLAMGVIMRYIMRIQLKTMRIMFALFFIVLSIFWSLSVFVLIIVKAFMIAA